MCTLSLQFFGDDDYTIAMNRDESRLRKPALQVIEVSTAQGSMIYPQDADALGSWIGINSSGVSLALLNHHPRIVPQSVGSIPDISKATRGEIVVKGLAFSAAHAASAWVQTLSAAQYRPFTFVAVDRSRGAAIECVVSDGASLRATQMDRGPLMFASSSFDADGVVATRQKLFDEHLAHASQDLESLHRSHLPAKGAYSVCMHRDDASSVSLTVVRCSADRIELGYAPGSPCEGSAFSIRRLPLSDMV